MDGRSMSHYARIAGHAALWVFVGAAAVFGALPAAENIGFSHRTHPLAWLGATGVPAALWFNLSAFAIPGVLAAFALSPLRGALPTHARWSARIGAQMVLLSAFAFAAQGLLPIDPEDLDGVASGLHGVAWTLWWLAFCAGNLLLAWGLRDMRDAGDREILFLTAQVVPACALFAEAVMPVALAQRLAFLLWFAWVAWASGRYARRRAATA
jgi:Protein of unknown function (DUF998)